MKKLKLICLIYFTVIGTIGFSLFMIQEGQQLITFANFSISQSGRYDLLEKNLEKMELTNATLNFITKWFAWPNPFAYTAYSLYGDSTKVYIETMRSNAVAHAPYLYFGKKITVQLQWKTIRRVKGGYLVKGNKFSCLMKEKPDKKVVNITGILKEDFFIFF